MHVGSETFNATQKIYTLDQAPPLVREDHERGEVISLALTVPEALYLKSVEKTIQTSLTLKSSCILSLWPLDEKIFRDFVANTKFKDINQEELCLSKIVSSIWNKTNEALKVMLLNQNEIDAELQLNARLQTLFGHCPVKWFTSRGVQCLTLMINNINLDAIPI